MANYARHAPDSAIGHDDTLAAVLELARVRKVGSGALEPRATPVVFGARTHEAANKSRESPRDPIRIDDSASERGIEQSRVLRLPFYDLDQPLKGQAHLIRILKRHENVLIESRCSLVPKVLSGTIEPPVHESHGVATSEAARKPPAKAFQTREAIRLSVAGGVREGPVCTELLVVEQYPSQGGARVRYGIVRRHGVVIDNGLLLHRTRE